MIVLDCETSGLDPRRDRLVLVGVAFDDDPPLVLHHPEDRDLIQQVLDLPADFIGQNVGFDFGFLECNGYRLPDPERWHDSALIAHVAGERKPGQTALARLSKKLIETGQLPADQLKAEEAINRWLSGARRAAKKAGQPRPEKGDAPAALLAPYLKADVIAARAVARHYGSMVNGQAPVLELERRCLPAIYAAEQRGVPLDLDAAHDLRDRINATLGDLRARLFDLADGAFNLNSPRQIERALTERGVDLSAMPRTPKTGQVMFTFESLAEIDDPLARALEEYRAEKKTHDYVQAIWTHEHGGRLYGTFRQVGTEVGRMSSGAPNLQNIPRSDLRVRYTVRAEPGRVLVGCDLDQAELRILSNYAPGGALAAAFRDGADVHQQTADQLGLSRDQGKTLNHAILYGGGASLIARRLGCTAAEASAIRERWWGLYPEVRRLRNQLYRMVKRRGYLETVGGRRHFFDAPNHMLLHRLVCGSAADLFKASVIELHAAGVEICLMIHDEVVAEADEADAERISRLLERALARDVRSRGVEIRGLVAEATTAERWSDFKQPGWTP